jgi:hypothetical protein
METGVNWDVVKEEMAQVPWEPTFDDDGEDRRVYLGTVMALYPSGKFYTPFAHGNVEICEACAKAGDVPCDETSPCSGDDCCEACRDAKYRAALESEADEHGFFIESGEGDPCDIFVVEHREV